MSADNDLVFVDASGNNYDVFLNNEEEGDLEQSLMLSNNNKRDIVSESLYKAMCTSDTTVSTPTEQPLEQVTPVSNSNLHRILLIKRRPHKCNQCLYSAETVERLEAHVKKVHLKEHLYHCTMCEYSTNHKAVFEEHQRTHTGEKPFECRHCSYRCTSKQNLAKHERIHKPDNPLACSLCSFIARNRNSLKFHKNTEHQEGEKVSDKHMRRLLKKYFTCAICGWEGSKTKGLLHLIHHPNQTPPSGLDVSILRKHGILK